MNLDLEDLDMNLDLEDLDMNQVDITNIMDIMAIQEHLKVAQI